MSYYYQKQTFDCEKCNCSFDAQNSLDNHQNAKSHWDTEDPRRCSCGKFFDCKEICEEHRENKEREYNFIPCLTCAKDFKTTKMLRRHEKDTFHFKRVYQDGSTWEMLHAYFEAYVAEKVMVTRTDRRRSRVEVQKKLRKIMENVRAQDGGDMYGKQIRTAGSCSTNTQVGKAEEFDFNIPLEVDLDSIQTSDVVNYSFGKEKIPLRRNKQLLSSAQYIPNGFAVAEIANESQQSILSCSYKKDIIPRYVQQNLYKKIKNAINEHDFSDEMQLLPNAQGPAITIIIKQANDHDISIDISAAIDTQIPVTQHGFPWPATRTCLTDRQIELVLNSGTHLVPKREHVWYISYSKAARTLMNVLDSWYECRRKCHKIIKRDFKHWKSLSTHGFQGISTYVFKHHLFWLNEKYTGENYWNNSNIGICYADMLKDLETRLRNRKLLNYFNKSENIIANKSDEVLDDLADNLEKRRQELAHIKLDVAKT